MIFRGLKDDLLGVCKRLHSAFDVRDVFVFGGIGLAGYGIWIVSPPAAFVVVGLAFFWLGIR